MKGEIINFYIKILTYEFQSATMKFKMLKFLYKNFYFINSSMTGSHRRVDKTKNHFLLIFYIKQSTVFNKKINENNF